MKKVFILMLALIMVLGLVGCGKSEEAKAVEELISNIGAVTIESSDTIQTARNSYNALSEEQKNEIENITTLTNAEEAFAECVEEFVENAKNESKMKLLDKKPKEAIAVLEEVLPFDSSIQNDIDIIYGHCFELNGVLIIKPNLLYNDIEEIGIKPHDSENVLDSFFYSIIDTDVFFDYSEYIATELVLNENETLESDTFIRYQFLDEASENVALELSIFDNKGEWAIGVQVLPQESLSNILDIIGSGQ